MSHPAGSALLLFGQAEIGDLRSAVIHRNVGEDALLVPGSAARTTFALTLVMRSGGAGWAGITQGELIEQDIDRLKVSMNDSCFMSSLHSASQQFHQAGSSTGRLRDAVSLLSEI